MARNDFPLAYSVTAELVPLFKEELQHCKVKPGETVVLFSDPMTNPHYPAAFMGAAKDLGAYVFELRVPFLTQTTRTIVESEHEDIVPPNGPLEAMKAADMVIDMSTVGWLYTEVHNEVLRSGTRVLMVNNSPEILRRMMPCDELRNRVLAGAKVMEQGRRLRWTTPAGTDLTFDKSGRKAVTQYGVADVPGRWDHWPGGLVGCAPIEGSAEGVVVLDIGDIILRLNRYVSEPIRCEFEQGRIVRIKGGVDAFLFKEYMDAWKDEKAYIPAHVGWGCEHRALWMQLALPGYGGHMDAESFYGDVTLGLGSNFLDLMGGKNRTHAHMDVCTRNGSFWVDDLQILKDGRIVAEGLA